MYKASERIIMVRFRKCYQANLAKMNKDQNFVVLHSHCSAGASAQTSKMKKLWHLSCSLLVMNEQLLMAAELTAIEFHKSLAYKPNVI